MKVAIAGYVPVLHRGYLDLFSAHPEATECYVFGQDLIDKTDYLRKDLRALSPSQAAKIIRGLNRFNKVDVLTINELNNLRNTSLILPDEDVSHTIAAKFLSSLTINYHPVFLRWDRRSTETAPTQPSGTKANKTDIPLLAKALHQAQLSSDIWRKVGALVITKDGQMKLGHNKALPSPHTPWMEGDPRIVFKKGIGIEMTTFVHAEANVIAAAAKDGIALKNATMYVTTFPCPACAKLIAESGISKLLYAEGYAVLDGQRVLNDANVTVRQIDIPSLPDKPGEWVPYQKQPT